MLIVMLMRYSNSFVSRTIRVFSDEKLLRQTGIRNRFHAHTDTQTFARVHAHSRRKPCCTNSHFLTLGGNQSGKAHCFDSRHMSSRRGVCQLINHLAADDLWSEQPYHDKVSEPCTFNYRSEGSTHISMQHPSQLLSIALR